MAEYILKELIKTDNQLEAENWKIESAGISAVKGAAANDKAKSVMSDLGIDLAQHESVNIDDLELSQQDLIITMSRKHSRALILKYPGLADKVFTLKEFIEAEGTDKAVKNGAESQNITDPFGLSEEVYRLTRDEIGEKLKVLVEKLKSFSLK